MTAADEAEGFELAVGGDAGDREDQAIAEAVDEATGPRDAGQAGLGELQVGDALAAQVIDEPGPTGRGVPGEHVRVAGQVGTEPFGQVGLGPGTGELAHVVVGGQSVELEDAGRADRCHGGVELTGRLGVNHPVGRRQCGGVGSHSRREGEVGLDDCRVVEGVPRGGLVRFGRERVVVGLVNRGQQVPPLVVGGGDERVLRFVLPERVDVVATERGGWARTGRDRR
nr:hypothetical protein [Cellulomonas sp. P24]